MSVKKEANGRRSISVEVEVPGTPEEVWDAIATGPGISKWFVPAQVEPHVGGKMVLNFGPAWIPSPKSPRGMRPTASVRTAMDWDRTHRRWQRSGPWKRAPGLAREERFGVLGRSAAQDLPTAYSSCRAKKAPARRKVSSVACRFAGTDCFFAPGSS